MRIGNFVKAVFFFWFIFMMFIYAFVDDGGITTKNWLDFLFMPIPSALLASLFTGVMCLFIYPFTRLYNYLTKDT